jgi:GalNAc-alpha-(1->4)-GalNAc-alpha-(1->3)-diNAcBac-PP-undecaprenol alpha-1,4-N-acetyl-D-galactosaminyltransferase
MKPRILFVIGSLTPGGAERVVSLLANECSRSGYPVGVLTIKTGEDAFPLLEQVERIRIDISGSSRSVIGAIDGYVRRRRAIREAIDSFHPNAVFSFLNYVNIRVLGAVRGAPYPVFVSERNTISAISGVRWRVLRRLLYPRARGLIVQTTRQRKQFRGFNRSISVIPNPVVVPNELSFSEKEPIILLVGRMSEQKQFDKFLSRMREIDLGEYRIAIAGEFRSPMRERIEAILEGSTLAERVELLGHVSETEPLYRKAAIFVLPSRYEGFPNALSEALSYGCACVSFDCPTGPSEMIEDRSNGFLVGDQDWDALIAGVQTVMHDHGIRRRFFDQAIEHQRRYALPAIAREWLSLADASGNGSRQGGI